MFRVSFFAGTLRLLLGSDSTNAEVPMNPMRRSIVFLLILATETCVHAGMPSPTWTVSKVGEMRFQSISFFLLGIVLSAFIVRWLWNSLRRDFPNLPFLSTRSSLGLVALWGAAFVLVLTMISGARELMTPGAWKQSGATYSLAENRPGQTSEETRNATEDQFVIRRRKLESLRFALWDFALNHGGRFPTFEERSVIDLQFWQSPDASRMEYRYVSAAHSPAVPQVLAMEPDIFGDVRLALLTSGEIVSLRSEAESLTTRSASEPSSEPATAEIPEEMR